MSRLMTGVDLSRCIIEPEQSLTLSFIDQQWNEDEIRKAWVILLWNLQHLDGPVLWGAAMAGVCGSHSYWPPLGSSF